MRLAFTISSYRLFDFVNLGIRQLRRLSPDAPILISDDAAPESPFIKKLAGEQSVEYLGSDKKRGHFAGDCTSIINAIAFAEAVGADVAVKISQRFVFRLPEALAAIERAFEDPTAAMAIPGQPKVAVGSKATQGFKNFGVLSDVVCVRPSLFPAARFLELYKARLVRETVPWKAFIECAVHEAHSSCNGGGRILTELTDHATPANPIYLRRYQNSEQEYQRLASSHGIGGRFPLWEWSAAEGRDYICNPIVV